MSLASSLVSMLAETCNTAPQLAPNRWWRSSAPPWSAESESGETRKEMSPASSLLSMLTDTHDTGPYWKQYRGRRRTAHRWNVTSEWSEMLNGMFPISSLVSRLENAHNIESLWLHSIGKRKIYFIQRAWQIDLARWKIWAQPTSEVFAILIDTRKDWNSRDLNVLQCWSINGHWLSLGHRMKSRKTIYHCSCLDLRSE